VAWSAECACLVRGLRGLVCASLARAQPFVWCEGGCEAQGHLVALCRAEACRLRMCVPHAASPHEPQVCCVRVAAWHSLCCRCVAHVMTDQRTCERALHSRIPCAPRLTLHASCARHQHLVRQREPGGLSIYAPRPVPWGRHALGCTGLGASTHRVAQLKQHVWGDVHVWARTSGVRARVDECDGGAHVCRTVSTQD
jgi:hypothetical protein